MLRRIPCERYLRYLIVHPDRLSDLVIARRVVEEDCLDYPARSYLKRLRTQLAPPPDFDPFDKYHGPSQRFLAKQGIRGLFFPDDATNGAQLLLRAPRAREYAETMIIAGAPAPPVARQISRHYGVACSPEAVIAYKSLFWDIDLLDSTEVRTLLRMRAHGTPNLGKKTDPETRFLEASHMQAFEKTVYKDPRRIAAELPRSPASAVIAEMYMGQMPSELDIGLLLLETRNTIALRISEEARGNMAGGADRAMKWATALDKLREVMEATVSPAAELEKQIQSLRLKTLPSSVPVLHELTQGQHTMDLQPAAAPDEEQDEEEEDADDDTE